MPSDEYMTETGARAGIVAVKLGHTEIFCIPSFETSTRRFEMWNFPEGQFLGCVWIVGKTSIPSSPVEIQYVTDTYLIPAFR